MRIFPFKLVVMSLIWLVGPLLKIWFSSSAEKTYTFSSWMWKQPYCDKHAHASRWLHLYAHNIQFLSLFQWRQYFKLFTWLMKMNIPLIFWYSDTDSVFTYTDYICRMQECSGVCIVLIFWHTLDLETIWFEYGLCLQLFTSDWITLDALQCNMGTGPWAAKYYPQGEQEGSVIISW